nr:hypothetical protein 398p2_00111 [Serratia entomophila]
MAMARAQAASMTGITGRLVTAPHSTRTGGRINSRLKWYRPSSAVTISVTFSGVATLPTTLVCPAIRYTTAAKTKLGNVVYIRCWIWL